MNPNNSQKLYGLYGSHISRANAIGYCRHHCAALTVKTLKCHECLKKQCNALKKYEEHDYWKQRAEKKEMKKARKMASTSYYN